ncbi:MerR family transcriptional regulator [Streptomyces sp. NPDC005963]|uniref:MerR family transcriptional regulator n=1 Tax=Streptomyces sp. NPDC005963 TaxID=3156721 RepID=UPI0033E62BB5
MAIGTEVVEPALTVDELAARAGVTVRTIRFYSTRGLLPPPDIGPRRVGRYGSEHLSRLALIDELQQQGMTLSAIERYVERLPDDINAQELAIHRALVASWTPDAAERISRAELTGRVGRSLTEQDVDRLTAMGAVRREEGDSETFRVDKGLLRLGAQLLELPIARETILAARTILAEHTRSAAHELTRLFHEEVVGPEDDHHAQGPAPDRAAAVRSLSAHLQPMVVQALVTAFQRSLQEELRTAFTAAAPSDRAPSPSDASTRSDTPRS